MMVGLNDVFVVITSIKFENFILKFNLGGDLIISGNSAAKIVLNYILIYFP